MIIVFLLYQPVVCKGFYKQEFWSVECDLEVWASILLVLVGLGWASSPGGGLYYFGPWRPLYSGSVTVGDILNSLTSLFSFIFTDLKTQYDESKHSHTHSRNSFRGFIRWLCRTVFNCNALERPQRPSGLPARLHTVSLMHKLCLLPSENSHISHCFNTLIHYPDMRLFILFTKIISSLWYRWFIVQ